MIQLAGSGDCSRGSPEDSREFLRQQESEDTHAPRVIRGGQRPHERRLSSRAQALWCEVRLEQGAPSSPEATARGPPSPRPRRASALAAGATRPGGGPPRIRSPAPPPTTRGPQPCPRARREWAGSVSSAAQCARSGLSAGAPSAWAGGRASTGSPRGEGVSGAARRLAPREARGPSAPRPRTARSAARSLRGAEAGREGRMKASAGREEEQRRLDNPSGTSFSLLTRPEVCRKGVPELRGRRSSCYACPAQYRRHVGSGQSRCTEAKNESAGAQTADL